MFHRFLITSLIFLLLIPAISMTEDRYELIGRNEQFETSFDTQTIRYYYDENGLKCIDVWTKVLYSEKGVIAKIQRRLQAKLPLEGYETLDYTAFHFLFTSDKAKVLETVDYTADEQVLERDDTPYAPWRDMVPESMLDGVFKVVSAYAAEHIGVLEVRSNKPINR